MIPRAVPAALSLCVLAGCGAVLGFEDIVVDPAAAPDASDAPDAVITDGGAATDAGPSAHCDALAPVLGAHELTELRGSEAITGQQHPRITRDELTIVFTHIVSAGGSDPVSTSMIAQRRTRTEAFGTPVPVRSAGSAPAFTALTASGGRFYFSQGAAGQRVLRTALFTHDALDVKSIGNLGDDKDSIYAFPAEQTQELFFARAARPAEPAVREIYRASGAGDAFAVATRVTSIETAGPDADVDAGFVKSYVEPILNDDGTHLYFAVYSSHPDGAYQGQSSTYVAFRTDTTRPEFGNPVAVPGFLDDPKKGGLGGLSPDECTLYTYRVGSDARFRLFVEERARN